MIKEPGGKLQNINNDMVKLLHTQLKEEAIEYQESVNDGNLVDQVDALIDSIYFTLGGLYRHGVTTQGAIILVDTFYGDDKPLDISMYEHLSHGALPVDSSIICGDLVSSADLYRNMSTRDATVTATGYLIQSLEVAMLGLISLNIDESTFVKLFCIIHEANMTKAKGKVASRPGFESPDACKPDNWVGPEAKMREVLDGLSK